MRVKRHIRPPRWAEWILRRSSFRTDSYSLLDDLDIEFSHRVSEKGKMSAGLWYGIHTVRAIPEFILQVIYWRFTMLFNYMKIAIRNLKKQKAFTLINVFGLAFGIACCLAIYMYINFEMSYDKYHHDLDRIYRIGARDISNPESQGSARTSGPPGQVLKDHYPQVEKVARLLPVHDFVMKRGEKVFYESKRFYADTELFSILTIPFVNGDPSTALDRPATVVMTQSLANKYFGDEDPLGQTLQINQRDYEVTGVMGDPPANTHLKADCYISMKLIEDRYPFDAWLLGNLYTYVKLRPDADLVTLNQQMEQFIERYGDEEAKSFEEADYAFFLQPVSDIHLFSHMRGEPEPCTKPEYLLLFGIIGLFVLLIACVNFINLSTARATKRSREVGLRKVVGSRRGQLVAQFMTESILLTFTAVVIGLLLFERSLPIFRNLTQIPITADDLFSFEIMSLVLVLVGFIGFVAGLYPAFVLSSFRPVQTLKGIVTNKLRGSGLRKTLVVIQFTISIILIIGTLVVSQQLSFMKNRSLGFDLDQKLVIPLRGPIDISENYELIKASLEQISGIHGSTVSSIVPGQQEGRWYVEAVDEDVENQVLNFNYVDPDYLSEYKLNLTAGRFFDKTIRTDIGTSFIINMAAVRAFGWTSASEALDKRLLLFQEGSIIGVVDDFHYKGLQSAIEPMAMMWDPQRFHSITLKIDTNSLENVMEQLRNTWQKFLPDHPFDYFFLDASFENQYHAEERIGKMLGGFTLLGVFIACLGLFGLTSFTAEQKTKEIGIRRTLGASVHSIMSLLTIGFLKWVLVANLIAWPIAYFSANQWLQNFAYRMDLKVSIFIMSAILALGIAMMTVSYQAAKAATKNPVDALKYE